MSKLKIQGSPGLPPAVPANDSRAAEGSLAAEKVSSGPARQLQEARQAVDIARSRLAENQTQAQYNPLGGPSRPSLYNPKELGIDKLAAHADPTNEAASTTKKESGIIYNGHAGLGGDGKRAKP